MRPARNLWAAALTTAALGAPTALAGAACAAPSLSDGVAVPRATRADASAAPRGARTDGARPVELRNVRGSLQNSCWLGADRLVLTQFAGGYNRGDARVRSVTLDASYRGTVTDTPAHGANMPAGCSHAGTVVYSADTDSGDAIMAVALPGGQPRTVLRRPGQFAWGAFLPE
ncbi:hypothetical protein [Actinoplanes sp. NPDC049118]|uniref:hypothetical protein n=1 Tax=Actinoplanes sp. NPDC049118 TaxID=3155769 RepID=UPI0034055FE1